MRKVRHKERGTVYEVIRTARMQTNDWEIPHHDEGGYLGGELVDMREVVVYRSVTNPTEIWVRPVEEFNDGRFEDVR